MGRRQIDPLGCVRAGATIITYTSEWEFGCCGGPLRDGDPWQAVVTALAADERFEAVQFEEPVALYLGHHDDGNRPGAVTIQARVQRLWTREPEVEGTAWHPPSGAHLQRIHVIPGYDMDAPATTTAGYVMELEIDEVTPQPVEGRSIRP